jgi:hypothetical protein
MQKLSAGKFHGALPEAVCGITLPGRRTYRESLYRQSVLNGQFSASGVGCLRSAQEVRSFLRKIEEQYGKAERIWVMDRGIPTEEVLAEVRQADPPIYYLVGTPKGRLTKLEKALLKLP